MTTERRMDSDLPRILGDIAAGPYPDYIDNVLSTTAQRRQRPAWTFPERWLPMETVAAQVTTTRFPLRTVGVLALIAILIVTALAVVVGTRQPPLPAPPYGLADNGRIAYAADGDIYVVDGPADQPSVLVGGVETDGDPQFSRDGRHMAFPRGEVGSQVLVIAGADGSSPIVVMSEPIDRISDMAFSPDGASVAFVGNEGGSASLGIATSDGTSLRWIEAGGATAVRAPTFVPPFGEALLLVIGTPETGGEAMARLEVETGAFEILVPAEPSSTFIGRPAPAPDGSRIAYSQWIEAQGQTAQHFTIIPTAGAEPTPLPLPPGTCCEGHPAWSNDGTRLAMDRFMNDGLKVVAIVDPAEGGRGTEILASLADTVDLIWSPDDRYLLGVGPLSGDVQAVAQFVIDVEAGQRLPDTLPTSSYPAWQRIGTGN